MAIGIMTRVWEKSPQKGTGLLLTLAMADVADDSGIGYAGVEYLQQRIRMSKRNTERQIDGLIDTGEIYRKAGQGRGNKSYFAVLTGMDKEHIAKTLLGYSKQLDIDPIEIGTIADAILEKRRQLDALLKGGKKTPNPASNSVEKTAKDLEKGVKVTHESRRSYDPLNTNTDTNVSLGDDPLGLDNPNPPEKLKMQKGKKETPLKVSSPISVQAFGGGLTNDSTMPYPLQGKSSVASPIENHEGLSPETKQAPSVTDSEPLRMLTWVDALTGNQMTVQAMDVKVVNFQSVKAHWNPVTQTWDSPDYIYIGRQNKAHNLPASKWANPFTIKRESEREAALVSYQGHLFEHSDLIASLPDLRGKTLVCWCSPKECHGHVLQKYADRRFPQDMLAKWVAEAEEAVAARPAPARPADFFQAWIEGVGKETIPVGFSYAPFLPFMKALIKDNCTTADLTCAGLLVRSWHEANGKPVIDWTPGPVIDTIRKALQLCKNSMSGADVTIFVAAKRAEAFWADKVVSFSYMATNIPQKKASRPAPAVNKPDPNCPLCSGSGMIVTEDEKHQKFSSACGCRGVK